MPCGAKEAGGVYRPRHPQESPFYRRVERFYPEFEAVYEERYQERYGFWRPIIGTVVRKFLECGALKLILPGKIARQTSGFIAWLLRLVVCGHGRPR